METVPASCFSSRFDRRRPRLQQLALHALVRPIILNPILGISHQHIPKETSKSNPGLPKRATQSAFSSRPERSNIELVGSKELGRRSNNLLRRSYGFSGNDGYIRGRTDNRRCHGSESNQPRMVEMTQPVNSAQGTQEAQQPWQLFSNSIRGERWAPRFLRLEITNFNTRSNLIALVKYRGSQLKPDHHSPADAVGRFRTTRWSVVLLSAQIATEGSLVP